MRTLRIRYSQHQKQTQHTHTSKNCITSTNNLSNKVANIEATTKCAYWTRTHTKKRKNKSERIDAIKIMCSGQ